MNWWKPALGGLLAAGSLVPILARRAPGRKQDARPVTRARLTKLLLKASPFVPGQRGGPVDERTLHGPAPGLGGPGRALAAERGLAAQRPLRRPAPAGGPSRRAVLSRRPPAPLGRGPHGGPSLGAGVSRCPGGDLFSGLFRSGTVSRRHGGVRPDSCSDGDSPRPHRRPLPSPCPPLPDGGGGNGPSGPEDHGRRGHPHLPLPPPPL